jgi:hypothetical protein
MKLRWISTAPVALALLGGAFFAMNSGVANAGSDDREVIRTGDCTGNSTWELKVKEEDGRALEVEFEVDQNRTGVKWHVILRNDGVKFFEGNRVTNARSGSFEVNRLSTDGQGIDRITARANNPQSGEICRGVVPW